MDRSPSTMGPLTARCLLAPGLALLLPLVLQAPEHREEEANRDQWQHPEAVMDAVGIRAGSHVADIGAGSGYFTFHLARRVGALGRVYAVEIQPVALADLDARASAAGLTQISSVFGTITDPRLPPESLDVVLVVNTYHELTEFDAMLEGFRRALKPGGLLAIIDRDAPPNNSRETYFRRHRLPSEVVRDDALSHGFRFLRSELGFTDPKSWYDSHWYFLIFQKPV